MESADYFCSNRDRQTDAQRGQIHNQLNYVGGGKNNSNILFGQLSTNSSSCIHITPATLVPVPRSTFTHRCLDTVKRPCPIAHGSHVLYYVSTETNMNRQITYVERELSEAQPTVPDDMSL